MILLSKVIQVRTMSKKDCPECGGELVQMLERPFKKGDMLDYEKDMVHYGHYCKKCKQMFKQKWEYIKDE